MTSQSKQFNPLHIKFKNYILCGLDDHSSLKNVFHKIDFEYI